MLISQILPISQTLQPLSLSKLLQLLPISQTLQTLSLSKLLQLLPISQLPQSLPLSHSVPHSGDRHDSLAPWPLREIYD